MVNDTHQFFNEYLESTDLSDILNSFERIKQCIPQGQVLDLEALKSISDSHSYQEFCTVIEKKTQQPEYANSPCADLSILVVGAGPAGLRTAIEARLLGAQVVVAEQRQTYSRNNILLLWDFTLQDLKGIGGKCFYKKLGAGALHHIPIRQLQILLTKIALLLGVKIVSGVAYQNLVTPTVEEKLWRAHFEPSTQLLDELQFNVLVAADGENSKIIVENNFDTKTLHFGTAIGITANFVNESTPEELNLDEFGIIRYCNQNLFQSLQDQYGINLENLVYYRSDTHYLVMTPKRDCVIAKGLVNEDHHDVSDLVSKTNVNKENLKQFVKEVATFLHLPERPFALTHTGEEDVTLFDFTKKHRCNEAIKIITNNDSRLLISVVGDSLLASHWPQGTGANKAVLGSLDAAWIFKSFASGHSTEEVLKEREMLFKLLQNASPDTLKTISQGHSLNPTCRYNFSSIASSYLKS